MAKIEFISYDGKWPCLCFGKLILKIDEETVCFGGSDETSYSSFWISGGGTNWRDEIEPIEEGPWELNIGDVPDKYKDIAEDLIDVFNNNVPYGCCGGCL